MRVFITPLMAATALLVAACSGGTEDSTLQRGRSASSTGAPTAGSATGSGSNASSTAGSAPAPAPPPAADTAPAGSDAGPAAPAPAPAPAALGSCGNPSCLGGGGLAGCKATDSAGDLVTMGCQDGACACFAGGQTTATFDGDVNSADDAVQLFLANCTCN